MKISVAVPAYNCADSIGKTVESIINCGLRDYEIVIVNDGSKDDTAAVIDALAEKYNFIKCVNQENGGVSSARNRALEEATGDYVWFFDADDSVDEYSMVDAVNIVEETHPDMLIFGMSFDYYHRGRRYRRDELVYSEEGVFSRNMVLNDLLGLFDANSLSSVCNKLIKRSLISDNEIQFNSSVIAMEDLLLVLECVSKCNEFYMLHSVIYRYNQPEDENGSERRLLRIPNLEEYMKPFEESLDNISELPAETRNQLLEKLYFMFKKQKTQHMEAEELAVEAELFVKSIYADMATTESNKAFAEDLKNGNFEKIIRQNRKTQIRHRIAVAVKSSVIYNAIKRKI